MSSKKKKKNILHGNAALSFDIFHIILMLKASSYTTKTRAEGPLDGLAGMFQ